MHRSFFRVVSSSTLIGCALADATPAQVPAYVAPQLHCARFLETSHSDIQTQTARGSVKAAADRRGVWGFRAQDSAGAIALDAWHDSLLASRSTAGSEVTADTDGLIGGRYRGLLSATGEYVSLAEPFIPDEVAEVVDLSGAARELLPPVPPLALSPGEKWKGPSLEISRLPDTLVAGRPLLHFRLESRSETSEAVPRGDTVPIPVRQILEEEGRIFWSTAAGLVRRTRDITIEATIPSGGRVQRPVRTRVVQRIELTRLPGRVECRRHD